MQVQVLNAAGTLYYVYTVGFDANMSGTTLTDGTYTETQQKALPGGVAPPPTYTNTNVIRAFVFGDNGNPYRPSVVYDGNGYAAYLKGGSNGKGEWQYTWDTFGHLTSATTPYGITTDYTWTYTVFPFGELTSVQEGTKSPTTISYYEPSGNLQQINSPKPGTTGSTQTVTTKATWSTLGNLLTLTTPGNNATTSNGVDAGITTTYNYKTDGGYSQSEALSTPPV
jgi:YD repeat-containing protein